MKHSSSASTVHGGGKRRGGIARGLVDRVVVRVTVRHEAGWHSGPLAWGRLITARTRNACGTAGAAAFADAAIAWATRMLLADPAGVVARLAPHQFHSSSASRVTAGAAGFLTFTQQSARPERYSEPSRFDTMPSQPSAQACR